MKIECKQIQWSDCIRYLGAYLDSQLKFSEYLKIKTKKAVYQLDRYSSTSVVIWVMWPFIFIFNLDLESML